MQVGDLVRWYIDIDGVIWYGIITKTSPPHRFHVQWAGNLDKQGWFHADDLRVVSCK